MMKVYDTADIGFLVRKKRIDLRMSQAQLSDISGKGVRFISDLENGKATMQVGKVLDILHILGFDVSVSARGGEK